VPISQSSASDDSSISSTSRTAPDAARTSRSPTNDDDPESSTRAISRNRTSMNLSPSIVNGIPRASSLGITPTGRTINPESMAGFDAGPALKRKATLSKASSCVRRTPTSRLVGGDPASTWVGQPNAPGDGAGVTGPSGDPDASAWIEHAPTISRAEIAKRTIDAFTQPSLRTAGHARGNLAWSGTAWTREEPASRRAPLDLATHPAVADRRT
jgi:hypothetical protein